jgi:hypothetical protein
MRPPRICRPSILCIEYDRIDAKRPGQALRASQAGCDDILAAYVSSCSFALVLVDAITTMVPMITTPMLTAWTQ